MQFHSLVNFGEASQRCLPGNPGTRMRLYTLSISESHCLARQSVSLPYFFPLKPPTDKLLTVLSYGESKASQFLHEIVICSQ